jgi:hypothetical protein
VADDALKALVVPAASTPPDGMNEPDQRKAPGPFRKFTSYLLRSSRSEGD